MKQRKNYKVLLFYWSLIHDNKGIYLVPIAPTVLEEARRKIKKIHKALKSSIVSVLEDKLRQE